MSRVSILGLVGALALGLFWFLTRGDESRSGASSVAPAPAAALETSARAAELAAPATGAEEASLSAAPAEERARRSPLSEERVTIAGRVAVGGGVPEDEHASVTAEVYVGAVNQRGNVQLADAPVATDGSFTLVVPRDTRYALLDLEATTLRLDEAVRAEPGQRDVLLHPIILASVHGRVILPLGATMKANQGRWLGVQVECRPVATHTASEPSGYFAEDGTFGRVQPDARGEFEFPFLPIGVPLSLHVEHAFGPAEERELEPLLAGERREVLVTLERGLMVAGRVLDEHDRPVEGVSVSARPPQPGFLFTEYSSDDPKTDIEGHFSLSRLPRATLQIAACGKDLLGFGEALVDGTAGDVDGLELRVTRGACIEGTVAWPDGTPAEKFFVGAVGPNGRSDSFTNGRFRLRVAEEGLYDLRATAARATDVGTAQARGVRAGDPIITLVLETKAAVQVDGTVIDDGGEPVESFDVLWSPTPESLVRHWESSTGRAGHFHLGGLSAGALSMTVRADGFRAKAQTLEIGARTSESVRFVLTRAGVVRGRVVDPDGHGVADAEVADLDGASCRTAADGAFELVTDASALRLVARKAGFAPSEALALELLPGEIVEGVSLRLREGCRIEGRVLDAGGRPVALAHVDAAGPWVESDGSGAFVLQDLPPGPREIQATLEANGQVVRASVDLRPGRSATLELRFAEPDPVRLHGRIRRQGKPLACSLSLDSPTSQVSVHVGPDGLCEATVVRPGDFVGLLWIEESDCRSLKLHVPDADDFEFEVDVDTLPRIEK